MRVLGIDPGTATTGFGAIESSGSRIKLIDYGIIATRPDMDMAGRLCIVNRELHRVLEEINPDAVAVEQLYYHRNAKTVIPVAQSRGVVLMTTAMAGIPVSEYTPLQVKQAVVGYGSAEKKQVQFMVQRILAMNCLPKPDDAADALAIAICHVNSYGRGAYVK